MRTRNPKLAVVVCWTALFLAPVLHAQTHIIAYEYPVGVVPNQTNENRMVANDFEVLQPITIWQLGVFDAGGDGISNAVLTVQLYGRNGNSGTLLETLTFDTANPGILVGTTRFKTLAKPVTLLPGAYTIAAGGFDSANPYVKTTEPPYSGTPTWEGNTGGGLIRLRGGGRQGEMGRFPSRAGRGPARAFVAGNFVYSAATLPSPPYASDYAALVEGVRNFPVDIPKHLGSIGVFNRGSFPVIVEPGGTRQVLEAAGVYNNNTNAARAVAFAHTQFVHARDDARAVLLENAIRWVSRKRSSSEIVVGVMSPVGTNFFIRQGYRVQPLSAASMTTNDLAGIDALVVHWHSNMGETAVQRIEEFNARGGGIVVAMTTWGFVHQGNLRPFAGVNRVLQPFGLAFRPIMAHVVDLAFTNISPVAVPQYFSAFPAAELLWQERSGQTRLTSLERAIALNTLNYAINARPDLMGELAAISTGTTNRHGAASPIAGPQNFVDALVMIGAQASTNRLGEWAVDRGDLVARSRRGAVEYDFNLHDADLYQIRIEGTQDIAASRHSRFDLIVSVDGVNLGAHRLTAGPGTVGAVDVPGPYLSAGPHTIRIAWDNAVSGSSLRIKTVRLQNRVGNDDDQNGVKDWVEQFVASRSRLNRTNEFLKSYVSPLCVEGSDVYPTMVRMSVEGPQNGTVKVVAEPGPNGRWYADVPLSPAPSTPTILSIVYQNGAVSQFRHIEWVPVNLLSASDVTIRKGDSLLLTARPEGNPQGQVSIVVGTNQMPIRLAPQPYKFTEAGVHTVTGTFTPSGGTPSTRSIRVTVVEHQFPDNPAAWEMKQRDWDLPVAGPGVVFDSDLRLIFTPVADLAEGGTRMGLITDQNEPRYILSRLGQGGPVLSSAKVNGFRLWSAMDTYCNVIETYEDGSQLVEMMLVMSPVVRDVTVRLNVIVGGVLFEDGTTVKDLTAADFDAFGQSVVRFLRPQSAKTSICHSIKVYQNSTLLGSHQ